MEDHLLASVRSTVFKESETLEGTCTKIEGYDFNRGVNYTQLLKSMVSIGFQASNLGDAIEVVNQMLDWRLADECSIEDCTEEEEKDPAYRESVRCKVFLGFTSNLISSGVRDTVRYLVEHHMNCDPTKTIKVPERFDYELCLSLLRASATSQIQLDSNGTLQKA
ncbi:hypothetical protein L1049_022752 [Liquidambar formosana]|uniref:Deoxyhypusine synthase n=1 Tax=Liquidambar formosana TaxID=63359 RepID=A0AAP0WS11_LIQFO